MMAQKDKIKEKKIEYEDLEKLSKSILEGLQKNSCKDPNCNHCPVWNLQTLIELLLIESNLNYLEVLGMLEQIKHNHIKCFEESVDEEEDSEDEEEEEDEN